MKLIKKIFKWFIELFYKEYILAVSFNNTWGDSDDRQYRVRKFYKISDKHIKFLDHERNVVEIRGATGLNVRIEEIH